MYRSKFLAVVLLLSLFILCMISMVSTMTSDKFGEVDEPPGMEVRLEIPLNAKKSTVEPTFTINESKVSPESKTFRVTAYCACKKCCGKSPEHPAYGITATGTRATQGRTIAVDPTVIPLGSFVEIEGMGVRVAEDTGGHIKGNRIDIYFENHQEALNFGVQDLKGEVL